MKSFSIHAFAVLSLFTLVQPTLSAQTPQTALLPSKTLPGTQPELDTAIRDYLLAHPEVILESVRAYDAHKKQIAADRVRDNVRAHLAELTNAETPALTVAKTSVVPVTVVEFFDYRCGFCKKTASTVLGLGGTPGVRVVYKDLPILGSDSVIAAQAALAARAQGGYQKLHDAMLASEAQLTPALIDKLAVENGLDLVRLKADMKSPAVNAEISRNLDLAQKLNVEATPTFVVGDQLVGGALTPQAFKAMIDNARGSSNAVARVEPAQPASQPAR